MPDELSELERRLAGWQPAAPTNLSRERMLFEAGRASAVSARGPWTLSACLAMVCASLGAGWAAERSGRIQAENVAARLTPREAPTAIEPTSSIPPPTMPRRPPDPSSYFALTQRAELIVSGLAPSEAGPVSDVTESLDMGSLRVRNWGRAPSL
ncbi:MAG: hypothetical protein KatS3mg108_0757 [Isosphaeraceae bacterium]|jgi:hypothetical protein|nr:MAG: hypothetical protein KatS3mg108_0757 [Isosphaeraceae bacterium]